MIGELKLARIAHGPDRPLTCVKAPSADSKITGAETAAPDQPFGVIILPASVPPSASSGGLRRVAAGLRDKSTTLNLAVRTVVRSAAGKLGCTDIAATTRAVAALFALRQQE